MTTSQDTPKDLDLTVLCCTYNRRDDLREMLQSTLGQKAIGLRFEVVVVDNNSTDGTREEVEQLILAGHDNLRYVFEPRQGKSYALNTGLAAIRGRHHVVIDDDQLLPEGYLATVQRLILHYPMPCCIGGKVLPLWQATPPRWLTRKHWSPIAILDYGEKPLWIGLDRPLCLLAGVFRTEDVLAAGGYDLALGLTNSTIGSTEDADMLSRMLATGKTALYSPEIVLMHKIPAHRMTKSYFRRWHTGHGRFYAFMREPSVERASIRILGIPGHLLRAAVKDTGLWLGSLLRGNGDSAFDAELRLRFAAGFVSTRLAQGTPRQPQTDAP